MVYNLFLAKAFYLIIFMTSPLIPCISHVFYVAMVIPYYFQLPISNVSLAIKIEKLMMQNIWILLNLSTIYCRGILMKTLADASTERQSLSAQQIILNALGFCLTVVTTVIITVYAKRRLKELQEEDKMLLLQ